MMDLLLLSNRVIMIPENKKTSLHLEAGLGFAQRIPKNNLPRWRVEGFGLRLRIILG
jgi:hypothetical protein